MYRPTPFVPLTASPVPVFSIPLKMIHLFSAPFFCLEVGTAKLIVIDLISAGLNSLLLNY